MISFRALGVLTYLLTTGESATYRHLAKVTQEGADAIKTALKELENEGYIQRKSYKLGSRFVTESVLTEEAQQFFASERVSRSLLQLAGLTSTSYLTTNLLTISTGEAREEYQTVEVENMPYDFFGKTSSDDEAVEERRKAQEQKKLEYAEAKSATQAKRSMIRQNLKPKDWTSLDLGHEFAHRVHQMWHIQPWSLTQSRFVPALADMRKRLDTDGEVEVLMLDIFFQSINTEKYDSADVLWKMFITRAPQLAPQAKRLLEAPERFEQAVEEAVDSWEGII